MTAARSEIVPLGSAGEQFKRELQRLEADILGLGPSGVGGRVMLASRTVADDVWVLRAYSDTEAAVFYLAHPYTAACPNTRHWSPVLASRPALAPLRKHLVATSDVTIVARDGEALPAYLTLPSASPPSSGDSGGHGGSGGSDGSGRRLPLALVLHGGPSARDYAGFDPLVQLLASRGMAVLSVNYRGSTGFGQRFAMLGNGDVQGMHNDVEDARLWAVNTGVADPSRIAVVGASWGGYLALGAATAIAEPVLASADDNANGDGESSGAGGAGSLYAAVVAIVPLVSIGAANTSPAFRGDPLVSRYWRQVYGKLISDNRAAAERMSPVHRLGKLRGNTLLLIHGEADPRVPRAHGDAVAAAAAEMGLRGAHLTYAREGHSIRKESNVVHMYHSVEVFLCRALGLPPPPPLGAKACEGNSCTAHWTSPPGLLKEEEAQPA